MKWSKRRIGIDRIDHDGAFGVFKAKVVQRAAAKQNAGRVVKIKMHVHKSVPFFYNFVPSGLTGLVFRCSISIEPKVRFKSSVFTKSLNLFGKEGVLCFIRSARSPA